MVTRSRPPAPGSGIVPEVVTKDPQLVRPSRWSSKHKVDIFMAVDYLGTRFRIGDHVAMYTGEGREWVCVLETLYKDPNTGQPKFKGRWFWSVADVEAAKGDMGDEMRPSKCADHELLCCDNRDTNLVESMSRKCNILSYDNFQLVRKVVMRPGSTWKKTYFCERQYYHKAHRFSELGSLLFPGDPIPPELRSAAGLPEPLPDRDVVALDDEEGYREPPYSAIAKRNVTAGKEDDPEKLIGDPVFLW